jgi:hypothetical protein
MTSKQKSKIPGKAARSSAANIKRDSTPVSAGMKARKDGGHDWTIQLHGRVVTARTSRSSVTAISRIGSDFDAALKRLAKK